MPRNTASFESIMPEASVSADEGSAKIFITIDKGFILNVAIVSNVFFPYYRVSHFGL